MLQHCSGNNFTDQVFQRGRWRLLWLAWRRLGAVEPKFLQAWATYFHCVHWVIAVRVGAHIVDIDAKPPKLVCGGPLTAAAVAFVSSFDAHGFLNLCGAAGWIALHRHCKLVLLQSLAPCRSSFRNGLQWHSIPAGISTSRTARIPFAAALLCFARQPIRARRDSLRGPGRRVCNWLARVCVLASFRLPHVIVR